MLYRPIGDRIARRCVFGALLMAIAPACSDAPSGVEKSKLRPTDPLMVTFVEEGADIFTVYPDEATMAAAMSESNTSGDTLKICEEWGGCSDLSDEQKDEVANFAYMLMGAGNPNCWEIGQSLYRLLYNNKIKWGYEDSNRSAYFGTVPATDYEYMILANRVGWALWENRGVLIHEGFHGAGGRSFASTSSLRRQENDSVYDPQARQRESECLNPF